MDPPHRLLFRCCPVCEVLEWCRTANEMHTREEIAWMKEHRDYPPTEEDIRH